MRPLRLVPLPDGRTLAVDDIGDPEGVPVVYLHGTPDSRLARHPDDTIAARAGIRLLAVDRPGAGDSSPHAQASLRDLGADLAVVLDTLHVERAALLGWSAGGLFALACAAVLGPRVAAVSLVGTVPPVEAYTDPDLVGSLGPARRHFVEMAGEVPPRELAAELAPYLVPQPIDAVLALDHVLESAGELGRAELAAVPGAADQLARALVASVSGGLGGVEHDLVLQLEPGLDLSAIEAPVRTLHGSEDPASPPRVGAWLAARLPRAVVEVAPGAGHHVLFPRWQPILEAVVGAVANPGIGDGRC